MATNALETAPYAPPQNVLGVLHYARRRKVPDVLDVSTVKSIGIPEGNASRTIATFRFLHLVDEDGLKQDTFERLARATDDEYPEQLAQVIREAYATIFTYWEPTEDDTVKLNNLFRQHYNPQAQKTRMVTLFLALCREAGIISGSQVESRPRARRATAPKEQGTKRTRGARSAESAEAEQVSLFRQAATPTAPSAVDAGEIDGYYALCLETMKRLPTTHRWTAKQRAKWLQAIAANVDLLVEVEDAADMPTHEVTVVEADRARY